MSVAVRHRLDARVLGRFSVTVDGRPIDAGRWRHRSASRLFKLLLVTPGHRLAREAAAEQLWPGTDPEHQATNLRKALHFARHALSDDVDVDPILLADRTHIELDPVVDLHLDLDDLIGASQGAADTVDDDRLLELGREMLLPDDLYEDWLAGLRERLAARWAAAALRAARAYLDAGDHDAAAELIDELLARDPADEEAHRIAIEMLGAQGRHHAARRQFFRCRRELSLAYGVVPSKETLDALVRSEAATPVATREAAPIVGRERELTRFDELLERHQPGFAESLVVRGEAGIGKTRLIEELSAYLRASGWRVLDGRCHEAARELAFGPLRGALKRLAPEDLTGWPEPASSAIALLAPHLGVTVAIPFAAPAAVATAASMAFDLLSTSQPLALVVDDAHWIDDGTAGLLERAIAYPLVGRFLLVLGLRSDEPSSVRLRELLTALERGPGDELELEPLLRAEIAPLITPRLGGAKLDPAVVQLLFDRSQGNPLFCLELARTARDDGRIIVRAGTWRLNESVDASIVPSTVVRLVRGRCARLTRSTLRVLELASEFGEPVAFDAIVRASGSLPENVSDALDEAIRAGLLVEVAAGYRFAHPLFRAAVRELVPAARQPATALAVARAIALDANPLDVEAVDAALTSGADPVAVAERAIRAAAAGLAEARPLAVSFGIRAGSRLATLLERAAALSILERSLAVWSALPYAERSAFDVSGAFVTLGALRVARNDDAGATEAYRHAIETGRTAEALGAAYSALASVAYRHADYGSAMAHLREGLARAEGDELLRAILMMETGWLEFRHQRLEDSLSHLEEAEAVLRRVGSEAWMMRVLDSIWGPLESLGRGEESEAGLMRALQIARALPDAHWEVRVRTHLAFRFVGAGTPAESRAHVERGRALAQMIGDRYAEAVLVWSAAEMELALGNLEAAEAEIETELTLLERIGGNPRHEAIAHTHRSHVARRAGDPAKAAREATLAREAAGVAAIADPEFGRRIEGYLQAPVWVPMSM